MCRILQWSLLAFGVALGTTAAAEEKHYMVIFASQGEPRLPRLAHTFATFVKVTEPQGDNAEVAWEIATISWLPKSGIIVPARLAPEPGKNFDLAATLEWAKAQDAHITAWGPYEVKKELFENAQRQIKRLNSGQVSYKAINLRLNGGAISNCINAVSDIDDTGGLLFVGRAFGEVASGAVAEHLRSWIVNPEQTFPQIAKRLGLSKYDVRYQELASDKAPAK